MCLPGMSYLPISLGIIMAISIVTTYIIAVVKGDVEALFPYISDTGVDIPESCIFSQFFNMAGFLALCTMYVRYKLIEELNHGNDTTITRLSKVCLVLAVFSSLGLTLVGNFQETKIEYVHLTGALLVFGLGVLYSLLDTSISYRMHPNFNGIYICRARLAISLMSITTFLTTLIAGAISRELWSANMPSGHSRKHWKPDDPGYAAHLVSTFGEWFMALAFLMYFFTFIRDFQKFSLEVKTHLHVTHLDQIPTESPDEHTRLLI